MASSVEAPRTAQELHARLDVLMLLEKGWDDDGDGLPVDDHVAHIARQFIEKTPPLHGARLRLYPTPEGGLQFEWRDGVMSCSLELLPEYAATFEAFDTAKRKTVIEQRFPLFEVKQLVEVFAECDQYVKRIADTA